MRCSPVTSGETHRVEIVCYEVIMSGVRSAGGFGAGNIRNVDPYSHGNNACKHMKCIEHAVVAAVN